MDTLEGLQEALLIAKPRDFFNFSVRYIQEDRIDNISTNISSNIGNTTTTNNANSNMNSNSNYSSEELHCIQLLPYLINNLKEFQMKGKDDRIVVIFILH